MNKQLLSLMACLMVGMGCWAQNITIGGHRAVQDTLNHIWLCSIPQSYFGQDFSANVDYDENVRTLVIEGAAVANGGNYVFSRVAGGKNYSVSIYDLSGREVHRGSLQAEGTIVYSVNAARLAAGQYTVVFANGSERVVRKLVVK